jgi:acetyl-CoA synthetase
MTRQHVFPIQKEFAKRAWIKAKDYQSLYQLSIEDPITFWQQQAQQFLTWHKPWKSVMHGDFHHETIKWFDGAKLNVSVNCIDKHLPDRKHQTAIIWEGDEPTQTRHITYMQLHDEVCRIANWLKAQNVKKGDRVCIYMPMIPEAAFAMLACSRIGAIHSVVFGGFSPNALSDRINDAQCKIVITSDEGIRGAKHILLKANVDSALTKCPCVEQVLVFKHSGKQVPFTPEKNTWWHEVKNTLSTQCPPTMMNAEDPLFILYTSGSTGKPKGLLHTSAGYLLYTAMTHRYVFDYHEGDIYWCSADIGWITGHSYIIYGPLCNGATTLMFAGVPSYPTPERFWQIIDKHHVSIFYTAPTAIRALMREGNQWLDNTHRKSLRLLGSVGEPINPEVWEWYHQYVGNGQCPIVDTWWQTETGGAMMTPLPGACDLKPGAAMTPMFGIEPVLLDDKGQELEGPTTGRLAIKSPWPSIARTIYGNHERYKATYLHGGYYITGDGAKRDEDGHYWITGRIDDVLNVSGHRLGTAEIESALLEHEAVAEAAVIGIEHEIKGQAIHAFVLLKTNYLGSEELKKALIAKVGDIIGPIAKPDVIEWAPGLPKTRSGKIMRRILRKIANNEVDNLGDLSTLSSPEVIDKLLVNRR